MEKMKAFVIRGPGLASLEEREIPVPSPGEVLAKVRAAGICGSDAIFVSGKHPLISMGAATFPMIPGHEWSGEVVKVGEGVSGYKAGDRVVCEGMVTCGYCLSCKKGMYNLCVNYKELGFSIDGAFAEYVKVPARNLYKIPERLTFEEAALVEPASVAVHGMDVVSVNVGDTVVTIGDGAIGLLLMQVAKAKGAGLSILCGISDSKLRLGKELGADVIVNSLNESVPRTVERLTNGLGGDLIAWATPTAGQLEQAIQIVKRGGRILSVGVTGGKTGEVSPDMITLGEVTIRGACGGAHGWPGAISLLARGIINTSKMVSKTFPLEHIEKAMSERPEHVRVLLRP